jgi:hypothetical protein
MTRSKSTRRLPATSAPVSPLNRSQALAELIAAARLAIADLNVAAAGFDALGHHTSAGMARKQAGALLAALEKAQGFPEPIAADAPLKVGERVRIVSGFYAGVGRSKGRHNGTAESVTGWREDLIQISRGTSGKWCCCEQRHVQAPDTHAEGLEKASARSHREAPAAEAAPDAPKPRGPDYTPPGTPQPFMAACWMVMRSSGPGSGTQACRTLRRKLRTRSVRTCACWSRS